MPAAPLPQDEIENRLRELPGWTLEGDRITRTYRLPSHFAAATSPCTSPGSRTS